MSYKVQMKIKGAIGYFTDPSTGWVWVFAPDTLMGKKKPGPALPTQAAKAVDQNDLFRHDPMLMGGGPGLSVSLRGHTISVPDLSDTGGPTANASAFNLPQMSWVLNSANGGLPCKLAQKYDPRSPGAKPFLAAVLVIKTGELHINSGRKDILGRVPGVGATDTIEITGDSLNWIFDAPVANEKDPFVIELEPFAGGNTTQILVAAPANTGDTRHLGFMNHRSDQRQAAPGTHEPDYDFRWHYDVLDQRDEVAARVDENTIPIPTPAPTMVLGALSPCRPCEFCP